MGNGPTTNGKSPDEWEAGDLIEKLKTIEDGEDKDNALLARANVFVLRRWGVIMKRLDKLPAEVAKQVSDSISMQAPDQKEIRLGKLCLRGYGFLHVIGLLGFAAIIYLILSRHGLVP
jgi:hypothetical protein